MTTLDELENDFTVNEYGIIADPGKFEGETLATPFYYDIMMDGEGDVIEIDASDRLAFDIEDKYNFVVVYVSNDGFVSLGWFENRDDAEAASYMPDDYNDYEEEYSIDE